MTGTARYGRKPELLSATRSELLVVDVQEKLIPVIDGHEAVTNSIEFLLDTAALLNVPALISEQYPKGLGATISSVAAHPAVTSSFDKLRFSAADPFLAARQSEDRDQVVIVGIESHICVLQTAIELSREELQVVVVSDAVGSRNTKDHESALWRLRDGGIIVTSAESVAFEWCRVAGTDTFRQLSGLVQARDKSRT